MPFFQFPNSIADSLKSNYSNYKNFPIEIPQIFYLVEVNLSAKRTRNFFQKKNYLSLKTLGKSTCLK